MSRITTHIESDPRYEFDLLSAPQNAEKAATIHAAAEKFFQCGPMADEPKVSSLRRQDHPWPGSPNYPHEQGQKPRPNTIGRDGKRPQEDAQFAYGKADPINQPSRREESFDPFAEEAPKSLKLLREKYRPILESHDEKKLREMFHVKPFCFCGSPCAQFDGVVPVWVCGMFRRGYYLRLSALT
jgi:hypothetical protein